MEVHTPLTDDVLAQLHAGDQITITGIIYTARDAAHLRMIEALDRGEGLPVDLRGQIIYYVGPTPAKPGWVIGSAGPTTAVRVDPFTPRLLEAGLKATIGKGNRGSAVREAMVKYKAIYLGAIGGLGVVLAHHVKGAKVIAYEDLGTEAIRELQVEQFPVIVVNDIYGNDLFEQGKAQYAKPIAQKAG